jgi:hypothetical protein
MILRRLRRQSLCAAAAMLACSAAGCFHVPIQAPPFPEHVRLLPPDAPVQVVRKYQTYYYAWGLFPMTQSDQAMYIIEQERLVEARVVQGGLPEGIIAGFFGAIVLDGFILPQNLTVEGNRTPTLPAAAAPVAAAH